MRTDVLYKRIAADVRVLFDVVNPLFPITLPKQFESRNMNFRQFIDKLNAVTDPLGIYNEIEYDASVKIGEFGAVSGLWIPKTELPENHSFADVRVLWHIHPKTKRIQWSTYFWNRRRFYFWQLVMHELIHRYQTSEKTRVHRVVATDRKEKEQQAYYGNYDEVETHAHDAALELFVWWRDEPFRQAVAQARLIGGLTPPTVNTYDVFFPKGHPARRHFCRKMRAWYDTIRKNAEFYESLGLVKLV